MYRSILNLRVAVLTALAGLFLGGATANAQTVKSTALKNDTVISKIKHYDFNLESFQILNTRSLRHDTDHVTFALKVGDKIFPAKVKHMGDLGNGTYKVNLSFENVAVPSEKTKIVMTYMIINSGHKQDQVSAWLKKAAEAALKAGEKAAGGGLSGFIDSIGEGIIGVLFADCDGWVAGDRIHLTGKSLERFGRFHRETRNYAGLDSPTGCGSNSNYRVTWSVKQR